VLIYQLENAFYYNSDSLFLYDFIMQFKPKGRVLDVGSGSGVVGLLVARDVPKIVLEAVEKQEAFVFLSEQNARVNKIDYQVYHRDFLDHDAKPYNYIISNPPFYHPNVVQSDNVALNIARYNSHLMMDDFFKKVAQLLAPRGHFIFCYDAKQLQMIMSALSRVKLVVETLRYVHPRQGKSPTLVLIQARKNSKSLIKTLAPLYAFGEGQTFSDEAKAIYKRASTQSIKCQL
jgi:tRNA1(Val) A37 N6-methylase TrmN6